MNTKKRDPQERERESQSDRDIEKERERELKQKKNILVLSERKNNVAAVGALDYLWPLLRVCESLYVLL